MTEKKPESELEPVVRIFGLFIAILILIYGTVGFVNNDIYIPARKGNGSHNHGINGLLVYLSMVFIAGGLISNAIGHREKTNKKHSTLLMIAGLVSAIAWIISMFVNPTETN